MNGGIIVKKKIIVPAVIIVLAVIIAIPVISKSKDKQNEEITTAASKSSAQSNSRILVGHNGKSVYLNDKQSDIVREVINSIQATDTALFDGEKDYTIHIENNHFGSTDTVYYDMSKGLLGNASVLNIQGKEKKKLDGVLAGVLPDTDSTTTKFNPPPSAKWGDFTVKEVKGMTVILEKRYDDGKDEIYSFNCENYDRFEKMIFPKGAFVIVCYEEGKTVDNVCQITPYKIEFTDGM